MEEKNKEKNNTEVITAIYKVNLHCPECGSKIKKHLMITEGVQSVDIDIEKGEIKAKGKLDPLKVLKIIERKSKKKVELISPKVKPKESVTPDKKPKEIKEHFSLFLPLFKLTFALEEVQKQNRSRAEVNKGGAEGFEHATVRRRQTEVGEATAILFCAARCVSAKLLACECEVGGTKSATEEATKARWKGDGGEWSHEV